jgi:hypothetical protein
MSKTEELLDLIKGITLESPGAVRHELFHFIRKFWTEFTDPSLIQDAVCKQLELSPQSFNMMLMNPELCLGLESLHRNLRPGWLRDYIDYTAGHEAPEDFHMWVGLTVISAALRRKVWLDNVYHKLYPNLFTILVSPPGVGKKTTAINIGVNILREAVSDLRIISEKCTPEALAKRLAKPIEKHKESGGMKLESKAEGVIVAPELTVFMGSEQYNASLITLLTRLYDCADVQEVDTIARGVEKLKSVFVSLLGATTPSEISRAIPHAATGGGLMSRLSIIHKDSTPRIVPFAVPVDPTIRESLVNSLRKIDSDFNGPITFSPDGREWFIKYYRHHHRIVEKGTSTGTIERQPDHILKVAICLKASESIAATSPVMELNEDVLQRSFNIITLASSNCVDVVKMIDTSERGKTTQFVVEVLRRNGGVLSRTQLMKRVHRHLNCMELDAVVMTLSEADIVKAFTKDKIRYYKLTSLVDME